MLQQKDDRGYGELRGESSDKLGVDIRCADVLEAAGDSLQDLDGVFPRVAYTMPAVQPRSDGEDDDDERVAESRDKEERPLCCG